MEVTQETFYQEILYEVKPGNGGNIGVITLNRPEVLNALNRQMIQSLYANLQVWSVDSSIKAVVIRAVPGRAFCAGGDLRLIYEAYPQEKKTATTFFYEEYQLNRYIFHFPKPYIAFLDGITMGGGVGISIHGSHRVATDHLIFAMPETAIGFFPDIGASYFLPRLLGKIGYYLGLSGIKISADDCLALNIAQQKVASEHLDDLLSALADKNFGADPYRGVTTIIEQFAIQPKPSTLIAQRTEIDKIFSAKTIEEIVQHPAMTNLFLNKSPTSLKVAWHALQLGAQADFDTCMQQEFHLACHFLVSHDFIEGIRALIIDKDKTPHWQPAHLSEVSSEEVKKFFLPCEI